MSSLGNVVIVICAMIHQIMLAVPASEDGWRVSALSGLGLTPSSTRCHRPLLSQEPGGDSIDRSRPGWFPRPGAGADWLVALSNGL